MSIKVLVVDDSNVVQRMICEILSEDSEIEVVGTAKHGREGLDKVEELAPHVVVLDMEMPLMDGLEMLRELRQTHKISPAVIIFSHLTERGAEITLDALALGAQDFITKPRAFGDYQEVMQLMRGMLIEKVKLFGKLQVKRQQRKAKQNPQESVKIQPKSEPSTKVVPSSDPTASTGSNVLPEIIAIGVSVGGPPALTELLSNLTPDLSVPVVVVQHMPALYIEHFARRVDAQSQVKVVEAVHGQQLEPATVYIAPGDFHMVLEKLGEYNCLFTKKEEPVHACRPSIDVLFQSVSKVYGKKSLCVILTGVGKDGVDGCRAIHKSGGRVIAQDEETSLVWGTPGKVVELGISNEVLPISDIAPAITEHCTGS